MFSRCGFEIFNAATMFEKLTL